METKLQAALEAVDRMKKKAQYMAGGCETDAIRDIDLVRDTLLAIQQERETDRKAMEWLANVVTDHGGACAFCPGTCVDHAECPSEQERREIIIDTARKAVEG